MNYYDFQQSCWEDRAQTADESYICDYIESLQEVLGTSTVLHIGIGSNTLYKRLRTYRKFKITGVTLSVLEYENALKYLGEDFIPLLINKYNPSTDDIFKSYDFIVDNNITSYGESNEQNLEYFSRLLTHLTPSGQVLSHTLGLSYLTKGNLSEMIYTLGLEDTHKCTVRDNGVVIVQRL